MGTPPQKKAASFRLVKYYTLPCFSQINGDHCGVPHCTVLLEIISCDSWSTKRGMNGYDGFNLQWAWFVSTCTEYLLNTYCFYQCFRVEIEDHLTASDGISGLRILPSSSSWLKNLVAAQVRQIFLAHGNLYVHIRLHTRAGFHVLQVLSIRLVVSFGMIAKLTTATLMA